MVGRGYGGCDGGGFNMNVLLYDVHELVCLM